MFDYEPQTYGETYAPIYDEWYPEVADDDPQLAVLERLSRGRVLELGVGSGRVAVPLARRGVHVSGIDVSPAMLDRLREKAGDVTTYVGDFADVDVSERFPLICCLKNTFFMLTTQGDQVRRFANAAKALAPDGVFLLETFVPDPSRFDSGQRVNLKQMRTGAALVQTSVHDPTTQVVTSQDIYLGSRGVEVYPLKTRYVWPSELDLMAALAGLQLSERWSDWHGRPWSPESKSLISLYRPTT